MSASVTTWTRLEPLPRSQDLDDGLRNRLADPAWMLARQWQFMEFQGEDAGSPVEAVLTAESAAISRFHAGPPGDRPNRRSTTVDLTSVPMETVVERRPLEGGDARRGASGGSHWVRLLRAHGAADQVRKYLDAFGLQDRDVDRGPEGPGRDAIENWASSRVGAVIDGRRLAASFTPLINDGVVEKLPDVPKIPASRTGAVLRAAQDWFDWWSTVVSEPSRDAAWEPRRLEYDVSVQATLDAGAVTLRAADYGGGHLDWFNFDVEEDLNLGAPTPRAPSRTIRRHTLPTRVYYGGMPADRFWEFEDSEVSFGSLNGGRADLARMLLSEFALAYGNDWFAVPLDLRVGSVTRIDSLKVRDTFGVETSIDRAADHGSSAWTMYDLSRPSDAGDGLVFLPPTIGDSLVSDPIEDVTWLRDEMANLVWAVERRVAADDGGTVDMYEESQHALAAGSSQHITGDVGDAELIYRLNSYVPENWQPFVPVRPAGAPAGVVQLEMRPIRRVGSEGAVSVAAPRGSFLTARDPLVVEEEEIGREGRTTQRHWQLARWIDGSYHLWLSHRVRPGRGEGSSGLIFDIARPVS